MNLEQIKELVDVFDKSGLSKLEIKNEDFSVDMRKELTQPAATKSAPLLSSIPQTAQSEQVPSKEEMKPAPKEGEAVTSPMVGKFYRCPSPDSEPYVKGGDRVRKGEPIGIIEAMKIMNEIEAEFDCRIIEVVPDDGQPVEFGAELFRVERV